MRWSSPPVDTYTIVAQLWVDGVLLDSTARSAAVVPSRPTPRLSAALDGDLRSFGISQPVVVRGIASRQAGDFTAATLRVDIRDVDDASVLIASRSVAVDFVTDQVPFEAQWPVDAIATGRYTLSVYATAPIEVEGLVVIDEINVVDDLPPQLLNPSPDIDAIVGLPLTVVADVTDRHSGVNRVGVLIDGVEQIMGLRSDGRYTAVVDGLSEGPHRWQLQASDRRGNTAQGTERFVTVDSTAPTIDITGVEQGGLYNSARSVTVEVSDVHLAQRTLSLDGEVFVSGDAVSTEGAHVLFVSAMDTAGNRASEIIDFEIDTTPPAVVLQQPLDGAVVSISEIDVVGRTEAQATVRLVRGAHEVQVESDAQGQFRFADVPLDLGQNQITVTAMDRAGNIGAPGQAIVTREAAGDWSGTINTVTQVSLGSRVAGSVDLVVEPSPAANAITWTLVLNDASQQLLASASGQTNGSTTIPFEFDPGLTTPQLLELVLSIEGEANALDQRTVDLVDDSLPQIAVIEPEAQSYHPSAFNLTAEITDTYSDIQSAQWSVTEGVWRAFDSRLGDRWSALVELADGDYSVVVRAEDTAGNTAQAAVEATVDRLPPDIVITGVLDGEFYASSVAPAVDVNDNNLDSVELLLAGQPFNSGDTIALEGEYGLRVTAQDLAGNRAETELAFTLDFTPPTVDVLSPPDGLETDEAALPLVIQTERFASVSVETALQTYTANADALGHVTIPSILLQYGTNRLNIVATDRAGNDSEMVSVRIIRDPTKAISATIEVAETQLRPQQTQRCSATVANNAPLAAQVSIERALLNASGEVVDTWVIAQSGLSADQTVAFDWQPDMAELAFGRYRCAVALRVADRRETLADASFSYQAATIDATLALSVRARSQALVWTDTPEPENAAWQGWIQGEIITTSDRSQFVDALGDRLLTHVWLHDGLPELQPLEWEQLRSVVLRGGHLVVSGVHAEVLPRALQELLGLRLVGQPLLIDALAGVWGDAQLVQPVSASQVEVELATEVLLAGRVLDDRIFADAFERRSDFVFNDSFELLAAPLATRRAWGDGAALYFGLPSLPQLRDFAQQLQSTTAAVVPQYIAGNELTVQALVVNTGAQDQFDLRFQTVGPLALTASDMSVVLATSVSWSPEFGFRLGEGSEQTLIASLTAEQGGGQLEDVLVLQVQAIASIDQLVHMLNAQRLTHPSIATAIQHLEAANIATSTIRVRELRYAQQQLGAIDATELDPARAMLAWQLWISQPR